MSEDVAISIHARVSLHLRHSAFLAMTNGTDLVAAEEAFAKAEQSELDFEAMTTGSPIARSIDRIEKLERAALARIAAAAIDAQRANVSAATSKLSTAFKLYSRIADVACRIAPQPPNLEQVEIDISDPFVIVKAPAGTGATEPSKDAVLPQMTHSSIFTKKQLSGVQWSAAEVS